MKGGVSGCPKAPRSVYQESNPIPYGLEDKVWIGERRIGDRAIGTRKRVHDQDRTAGSVRYRRTDAPPSLCPLWLLPSCGQMGVSNGQGSGCSDGV